MLLGLFTRQKITEANANSTTHTVQRMDQRLIKPFLRCCTELRPFSYMLGPSRVQSGSQGLGPLRTGWLGRPASHYGDVVACTTS